MVAGSNGRVAWGFTNSYGDWSDLVLIDAEPDDPSRYRTPQGIRAIEMIEERIEIRVRRLASSASRTPSGGRWSAARRTAARGRCVGSRICPRPPISR